MIKWGVGTDNSRSIFNIRFIVHFFAVVICRRSIIILIAFNLFFFRPCESVLFVVYLQKFDPKCLPILILKLIINFMHKNFYVLYRPNSNWLPIRHSKVWSIQICKIFRFQQVISPFVHRKVKSEMSSDCRTSLFMQMLELNLLGHHSPLFHFHCYYTYILH
jgi:hypothetical protein